VSLGRQRVRRAPSIAIGIMLLAGSAWLCMPRRSHTFAELRSQCRWRDGVTVRFWEGNGGATTAFWYSVTVQPGMPWTEREVFFSYSNPVVASVTCEPEGIVVTANGTALTLKAVDLLSDPPSSLQFDHGEQTTDFPRDNWRPTDIARTAIGAVGALAAAYCLWPRSSRGSHDSAQPAAAADRGA
jgi:hypothetical protein